MGQLADLPTIAAAVARVRAAGKKIALANGAFDLLHVGHVRYLTGAKAYADILIVAVNSDASVRRAKGPQRPHIPENERAELVASLSSVDWVVLFDSDTVVPIVKALQPDFHVKGTDYTPETVPEASVVREYGGQVVIAGDPKNHSTTEILSRLQPKVK